MYGLVHIRSVIFAPRSNEQAKRFPSPCISPSLSTGIRYQVRLDIVLSGLQPQFFQKPA
jgi:hypothetical protein